MMVNASPHSVDADRFVHLIHQCERLLLLLHVLEFSQDFPVLDPRVGKDLQHLVAAPVRVLGKITGAGVLATDDQKDAIDRDCGNRVVVERTRGRATVDVVLATAVVRVELRVVV